MFGWRALRGLVGTLPAVITAQFSGEDIAPLLNISQGKLPWSVIGETKVKVRVYTELFGLYWTHRPT